MTTFKINAIDYIRGVNGIDYYAASTGNQGNYSSVGDLDTFTVDAGTGYPAKIGNHNAPEFTQYAVTIATSGNYALSCVYSYGVNPGNATSLFQVDTKFLASFNYAYTGGWNISDRTNIQIVHLNAGSRIFKHQMVFAGCDIWGWEFSLISADLVSIDIPATYQFEAMSLTETYRQYTNSLGDGVEQSASAGINPIKQEWQVTFMKMTNTQAISLRNLIRAAAGVRPLTWIPPLETIPLKWKIKSHTMTLQNGKIYSISCKFEQVY